MPRFHRSSALLLGCAVAAPWLTGSVDAVAQGLLGSGEKHEKATIELDPWLPTGAAIAIEPRPQGYDVPTCSLRRPVCVHAARSTPPSAALALLAAAETAYERLILALELPAPAPDGGRGGGDQLDLYLDTSVQSQESGTLAWSGVRVGLDPLDPWGFDRASGFCHVPAGGPDQYPRQATLCLAEAIALGLDPACTPSLRRSYATHLWLASGTPTNADLDAIDRLQRAPEAGFAFRERSPLSEGAALWFEHLEVSRGRGGPGTVATGMLAAEVGDTTPLELAWNNEPDLFDVLRHTLDERPAAVASLLGGFAVNRAFLGVRDDGTHLPRLGWVGAAGSVRFDWSIPWASLPRRVASTRPLAPNGAIYLWVDLDEVPVHAKLGFQAEWEPPASFQWVLVRVDREGREMTRLAAPFQERETSVVQQLENVAGAAGVLIVGTNLGGVDGNHPFDPDLEPFEPHGCTVYVTAL